MSEENPSQLPESQGQVEPSADSSSVTPALNNFQASDAWTKDAKEISLTEALISMPPTFRSIVDTALEQLPENTKADAKTDAWIKALAQSRAIGMAGFDGEAASTREGANWVFEVPSDVGKLRIVEPTLNVAQGASLTAERFRLLARKATGLSTHKVIPLYHSGFWVTIASPTDGDYLELLNQIAEQKISMGRSTYGFMFSSSMVYIKNLLVKFAIKHIESASIDVGADYSKLEEHIHLGDLPILEWGLACLTYPRGFQYRRACVASPTTCRHVVEALINPSLVQATDLSQLTRSQIAHMAKRNRASVTIEACKSYQNQFIIGASKLVKIVDGFSVQLKMPTVTDYISSGMRWVQDTEENYGQVLTMDETARDIYLSNQAKASSLRQFAHFVEKIVVGDPDGEHHSTEDRAAIEETLSDMAQNQVFEESFMEKVRVYRDSSLVSLIALPPHKCPSCGKHQGDAAQMFGGEQIVPIDPASVFFSLTAHIQQKILNREFT